jgi:two-component sensor histidine kinase
LHRRSGDASKDQKYCENDRGLHIEDPDRIATIGRIHHRLHSLDGVQTFALKQYLEDLCRDR